MDDLPYGKWTCADGREVLFNRFYEPIYHRRGGAAAEPVDRNEWVRWEKQEWFYDDSYSWGRVEKVGEAVLSGWGIEEGK
jgi:hypothetical protein